MIKFPVHVKTIFQQGGWFVVSLGLGMGFLTSAVFSQEEPLTVEGYMTIVETEIGLDQIVVQRNKPSRPVKDSSVPGSGTGQEKLLRFGDRGPSVTPDKIVDLNRFLKKAIEENRQLEADKAGLDQQLKNLRGQRTIEVNRIKSIGTERDSYKGMLEQAQKNVLKLTEQISDLESQIVEKDRQMQLMMVAPPTEVVGEGEEETLVEISAREVSGLRETIAALRRQLLEGEQNAARLSEEKKVENQAELMALSEQVAHLEEQLKNKDADYQARIAAMQEEKEQADEMVLGLGEQIKSLEERLSQQKTGTVPFQENQEEVSLQALAQNIVSETGPVKAAVPGPAAGLIALSPDSKNQRVTPDQELVVTPPDRAVAPEVSFVAERGDAAFRDRVQSQDVIAMLDRMSKQNEGLRSDEGRVHYNMGNIFFHQGDYARARDEFLLAVQLMPYDANAHFNLAFVSWEYLSDFKTALKHFQQYLWLNPEAEDANLVKEKIIAAQLEIMGNNDSSLEQDVREEQVYWWK